MTETWLLNETITSALAEQTVNFVSSGSEFVGIKSIAVTSGFELKYYVQQGSSTTDLPAYDTNGWLDTTYRIITFAIPPTGDLLTWLQANGNKFVTIEPSTYIFKDIPDTVSVQFDQGIDINFKVKGSTYSWNKILVDAKSRYGVCYFTTENPGWNVGYVDIHQTAQSNYVWGNYDASVEDMDGDADENVKTITIETAQNVLENFATWFNANTTKQTVPRKSYDLSTSAKWATLSSGNHNVQIVAKASGYQDSEKSAAVTVNKPAATQTIPAGAYVFKETPTLPTSAITPNFSSITSIKTYALTADNTYATEAVPLSETSGTYNFTPTAIEYTTSYGKNHYSQINNVWKWTTFAYDMATGSVKDYTATDTTKLRTWIIESDITVSADFYTWFMANVSAYTPTISAGTYKFNDTISAPASGSAVAFIGFKVNDTLYSSISVTSLVSVMYTKSIGEGLTVYNNNDKWAAVDRANQIITITADKEVPYKFYEWFTANANSYTPTYTLEAGTYKWANELVFTDTALPQLFDFTSNNKTFKACGMRKYNNPEFDEPGVERIQFGYGQNTTDLAFYYDDTWLINPEYQVITVAIDQNVSANFYKWAITDGNLVKQEPTPTGETWLLNETLSGRAMYDDSVKFTANNQAFKTLDWSSISLTSITDDDDLSTIYLYRNGAFTDLSFRTLTFETTPSGELLAWLKVNGVKQGGGVTDFKIKNIYNINTGISAGSDLRAKFDEPPTSETDFDIRFADTYSERHIKVTPTVPLNAKKIYVWGYGGGGDNSGNGMYISVSEVGEHTVAIANGKTSSQRVAYNNAEEYTFTQDLHAIRFYSDSYDV